MADQPTPNPTPEASPPPPPGLPYGVYVSNPKLRPAVASAVGLWNTAAGQEWLVIVDDPSKAHVVVMYGTPPGAPAAGLTSALGGQNMRWSTLKVWVNPQEVKDPLTPLAVSVVAHEFGHTFGLTHPGERGAEGLLTTSGVMGMASDTMPKVLPGEVQDALFSLGLSPHGNRPSPEALQKALLDTSGGEYGESTAGPLSSPADQQFYRRLGPESQWDFTKMKVPMLYEHLLLSDFRFPNKANRQLWTLGAGLVAQGAAARGAGSKDFGDATSYSFPQYVRDVVKVVDSLSEAPHKPQMTASGKMVQ